MKRELDELERRLANLKVLAAAMRSHPFPSKEEYRQMHLASSVDTARRLVDWGYAGVVFAAWRDSEKCVCYNAEQVPEGWLSRLGELAPGSTALYIFHTEEGENEQ